MCINNNYYKQLCVCILISCRNSRGENKYILITHDNVYLVLKTNFPALLRTFANIFYPSYIRHHNKALYTSYIPGTDRKAKYLSKQMKNKHCMNMN